MASAACANKVIDQDRLPDVVIELTDASLDASAKIAMINLDSGQVIVNECADQEFRGPDYVSQTTQVGDKKLVEVRLLGDIREPQNNVPVRDAIVDFVLQAANLAK